VRAWHICAGVQPCVLVKFLLNRGARFDAQETDSSGSNLFTYAVAHGDHASAALVFKRARARSNGTALTLSHEAWLAAASHATVDSALLRDMPLEGTAAATALRTAWQRQSSSGPDAGPGNKVLCITEPGLRAGQADCLQQTRPRCSSACARVAT
jgi:hypothetical protein